MGSTRPLLLGVLRQFGLCWENTVCADAECLAHSGPTAGALPELPSLHWPAPSRPPPERGALLAHTWPWWPRTSPLPGLRGPLSERERTTHLFPTQGALGAQEASGTPMLQVTLLSAEGGTVQGPHGLKVQITRLPPQCGSRAPGPHPLVCKTRRGLF